MPHQTGLADWLRNAGLAVVEVDGWKTRGSSSFNPGGVVCHHTAGGPSGDIPSLRVLIHGRSDLPGPLCQIGLARSGTCYVVAAGRANHAGSGGWKGLVGNSSVWGIEAENRGTNAAEPWKPAQLEAYHVLAAVLQEHTVKGPDEDYVCGHKEWAPNRKVDPHTLSMSEFRAIVAAILGGEGGFLMALTDAQQKKILQAAELLLNPEAFTDAVAVAIDAIAAGRAGSKVYPGLYKTGKSVNITFDDPSAPGDESKRRIFEVDMLVDVIGEELVGSGFQAKLWAKYGASAQLAKP